MNTCHFQKIVYDYYYKHPRPMPWRETHNPYHIFISEIMLQQTQVDRVRIKYEEFLQAFPTITDLAIAQFSEVLKVWKGLGYNRRAMWLYKAAQIIIERYSGVVPFSVEKLEELPGIGPNTAGSIAVFAYNKPVVFIETNIRSVFIHHFFNDKHNVHDKEIFPLIKITLDKHNPREWYWALMDYGVMLKKKYSNPSRKSKHHSKQSKFKGSNRQIRGNILKILLEKSHVSKQVLAQDLGVETDRIEKNLKDMEKEGLITQDNNKYSIS